MPASDGLDNLVGISCPSGVVFDDEAIDGGLYYKSTTDTKTPRVNRRFVSLAKKPSTALSQDADMGVKWKTAGMPRQPLAYLRMLVGCVVVDDRVDFLSCRHPRLDSPGRAPAPSLVRSY